MRAEPVPQTLRVARPASRRVFRAALAGTALLLAAGASVWAWRANGDDPAIATATVELGSIERTVTAVGALQPKEYVDVGTQVSGQLKKVHVEIGARVKKGALLAEIDPTRYEATVRNDRAGLENLKAQQRQQQAELELARTQLARNRNMYAERAVSKDAVETTEAAAKVAEARVAATRAQIQAAQATLEGNLANLGYARIHSPIDGTVVSQTTLEGQTVNASQSAPVIMRVANLDVMTVWAQVAEADIGKIKPAMPAYFSTLGMPDRRWRGTVRQVQPTPKTDNDVVLFNVLIDVDNEKLLLLPSMTVQAFFLLGEAHDVPIVPMSALTRDRNGERATYTATVQTASGPQVRSVRVGLVNRTSAQIVSGLAVGDEVVLPQPPPEPAGSPRTAGPQRGPSMGGPRL